MVRLELSSNKPLPLARLPRQFAHATSHEAARKILKDGPKLPRRSRGSCPLEGLAFAVSLHPEAWMEIAGTGPAIVVVEFSQPALAHTVLRAAYPDEMEARRVAEQLAHESEQR